jgi:hypothetical protein
MFTLTADPPVWVVCAVIGTNLLAGVGFGVLFWRKGLEAAILAHAFSHLVAVGVLAGASLL